MPDTRAPLGWEEAAERTGTSVRHLRRLVSDRRIPFIKIGNRVSFLEADLATWLESRRVSPAAALVERTTTAQGIAQVITDPKVLAEISAIISRALTDNETRVAS